MNFFMPSKQISVFEKKFKKMIDKLENKPTYTISEPMKKLYKAIDAEDRKILVEKFVEVVEIEISNIQSDNWVWVSTIYHQEGRTIMLSKKYFKNIPSHFGLDYNRCDHCGRIEKRKESHIIYNEISGEWKQIGSSCIKKMFAQGKYLAQFPFKLYEVIKLYGGCDVDSFYSGGWRVPDHYFQQALSIRKMIPYVVDYRKNVSAEWKKKVYDSRNRVIEEGTTSLFFDYYNQMICNNKEVVINEEYISNVFEYIKNLKANSEFIENMKKSFEAEYFARYEICNVFFACKMYEDSLLPSFRDEVERFGIKVGEKYQIEGSIIESSFIENCGYYGPEYYYLFTIKDNKSGFLFRKTGSNKSIFDKYQTEDGFYKFSVQIKFIDERKRRIEACGRISK